MKSLIAWFKKWWSNPPPVPPQPDEYELAKMRIVADTDRLTEILTGEGTVITEYGPVLTLNTLANILVERELSMRDILPMNKRPAIWELERLAKSTHSSLTTILNTSKRETPMKLTELSIILDSHGIPHRVHTTGNAVSLTLPNGSIDLAPVPSGWIVGENWEEFEPDVTPEVTATLNLLADVTQGTLKLYKNRVYLIVSGKPTFEVDLLEHLWKEGRVYRAPIQLTSTTKETPVSDLKYQALIDAVTADMSVYDRANTLIASVLLGLCTPKKSFKVVKTTDGLSKYVLNGTQFAIRLFNRSTDFTNVKRKGDVSDAVLKHTLGLLSLDAYDLVYKLNRTMNITQIVLSQDMAEFCFRIDDSTVFNLSFSWELETNEAK